MTTRWFNARSKTPRKGEGVGITGANIVDPRRGNGGPCTDIIWSGNVMQNCRDAYRIGGESTASGTATYENCMDQISYLNTSGTTWKNDQAWCDGYNSQYVGSVTFDGWYVCSGTSNAGFEPGLWEHGRRWRHQQHVPRNPPTNFK
jgi:hypothetical protein